MVQSASKEPIEGEAALLLLAEMSVLIVARGKKTIRIDLTGGRPSDSELTARFLRMNYWVTASLSDTN